MIAPDVPLKNLGTLSEEAAPPLWIILSLEFEKIVADEAIQALFQHGTAIVGEQYTQKAAYNLIFRPKLSVRQQLSELVEGDRQGLDKILDGITIDNYEVVFTGKSTADFNDAPTYKRIVGDFAAVKFNKETEFPEIGIRVPAVLSVAREVSFTFVQALRDVVAEFHNNRTNPLLTLLKAKSGNIEAEAFSPITKQVKALNDSIGGLNDVLAVRGDITQTIKAAAGEAYSPSSLSIRSDLPEDADKLFQSLKLFVGESGEAYEGSINELSLGGANLIYLTLKLLEFKYQREKMPVANFLLIEEPEAHIHTHIQKTLFDRLNYADTQIIYSTHSVHISEVSKIQNMNILGRDGLACEAYQPATGLEPQEIKSVQRYLDAVRSNLLFAKSIILVEGDAEEIVIPSLIKAVMGVSLDELGISLINIRSTGFQNVGRLFHDDRVRKRCAIITDLDTAIMDTKLNDDDSKALKKFKLHIEGAQAKGIERQLDLNEFCDENQWLSVFYAKYTFEVEFVRAGNADVVVGLLSDVYVDAGTIEGARAELQSTDVSLYGRRVLTMAANEGKGWFALLLAEAAGPTTVIPRYILDALVFANPALSLEVWYHIFDYRLRVNQEAGVDVVIIDESRVHLDRFRCGEVTLGQLKGEFFKTLPTDRIHDVVAAFVS
ncbi:ATP-dependent nuclease [Paraburkholderia tropica]|uniref:ATP-dependent nuclease n=1 Tax=Paraburkholderia tropica TaxID=92647 RepID=UPI002AB6F220|nr:TOPRIM nucleotidyl transferase/hydrolase domain-containing protein [Paraburkholderia tropica]